MNRWLPIGVGLYLVLSIGCLLVAYLQAVSLAPVLAPVVWLLGPPGLLFHGTRMLQVYGFFTLLFWGLVLAATASRRRKALLVLLSVGAAVVWLVAGFAIIAVLT